MSTTLEVYPRTTVAPSFAEVLDLGTRRVQQLLLARGVRAMPELGVTVRSNGTHGFVPIDVSRPAIWDSSEYAWFFVAGIVGGTDVSHMSISNDDLNYWKSVLEEHGPAQKRKSERAKSWLVCRAVLTGRSDDPQGNLQSSTSLMGCSRRCLPS